ncbi:MAG: hypothetical protein ACXABH_15080, partial [Candidatus Thorarchaeota archaeon]
FHIFAAEVNLPWINPMSDGPDSGQFELEVIKQPTTRYDSLNVTDGFCRKCLLSRESEFVTWVKQYRRGGASTENYSFYIIGPKGTFEAFRIEGARASMGDDFNVIRLNGHENVASIDSKFGDLGGEFTVRIKDPVLASNEWFCRVLQCFSIMILYRGKIRAKINNGFHKWKKGKWEPSQHRYEVSLLANPRKLTLKLDELEEV